MSWWKRKPKPTNGGDSDNYARAKLAFASGDLNSALTLLMKEQDVNPKNVAAQLLVGKCFVKAAKYPQAFQVYSALVMYAEIRGHADLRREEIDGLMVEMFVGWAEQTEKAGFPESALQLFTKAANFYGEPFGGSRTIDIIGLDVGLERQMPTAQVWADIINQRPAQGSSDS